MIAVGAIALGLAGMAAPASSEPVVHVYDVRITGALRTTFSLPSRPLPLDVAWSETSTWVETYKGVRLQVQTPEYLPEPTVALRMEGKGTITGTTRYTTSGGRSKTCEWRTSRPEPGSLRLVGTPYSGSATGARRYQLDLVTGRKRGARTARAPASCSYFENPRWAKFSGLSLRGGGGSATGWVDTRGVQLGVAFSTAQQTGRLGYPLAPLSAGGGLVLVLEGKAKEQSGRLVSEGTARITFVPRPS